MQRATVIGLTSTAVRGVMSEAQTTNSAWLSGENYTHVKEGHNIRPTGVGITRVRKEKVTRCSKTFHLNHSLTN